MTNIFDEVQILLDQYNDMADVGTPQESNAVHAAAEALGVEFSISYKKYLERWGTVAFGPNEYMGLGSGDVQDVVKFTIKKREAVSLPNHLIVVRDNEGDEYFCLDTSKLANSECPVVVWDVPTATISRDKANSFDEFLLQDIKDFAE